MTGKQWLALLCFFILYLFLGASVFYHIEQDLETQRRAVLQQQRVDLHALLTSSVPKNSSLIRAIYAKVGELCSDDVHVDAPTKPYQWTFYHSFFFSFIVCSTIGYGNISPSNTTGKMFMILYALIGIPVNGFLFAGLGDFFGKTFVGIYNRYKIYKMATSKNYMPMRFTMIGRILLYLTPGIVLFIFIPSCLFSYFEDWPYTTSIYYSFVTLTTIGFGDYVATFNGHTASDFGVWFYFYEIFVILWFIFGLGYLVMILGFIAKGMRSKRITRLEKQLAHNIKSTQQRIWHGVTKDVGYLRRILNELYMMKFKPVYNDDPYECSPSLVRSASCPDLQLYRAEAEQSFGQRRRRAMSMQYYGSDTTTTEDDDDDDVNAAESTANDDGFEIRRRFGAPLVRIQSDTDLQRIDRARTFESHSPFDSSSDAADHILAKVVNALGSIRPVTSADDDPNDSQSVLDLAMEAGSLAGSGGIHGFSDADILASEYVRNASGWTLNQSAEAASSFASAATPRQRRRARAASVFCVPSGDVSATATRPAAFGAAPHEWTWSGNNAAQVQEFLRKANKPRKPSLFRSVLFGQSMSAAASDASVFSTAGVGEKAGSMGKLSAGGSVSIDIPGQPSTSSLPDMLNEARAAPPAEERTNMFARINPFRKRVLNANAAHRLSLSGLESGPQQYLERRGREPRPSQPLTARQYLQSTARGRRSAFSVLTTAEPEQDDLLETTTIADLIRALELVHTSVQCGDGLTTTDAGSPDSPRRKLGLASLTPPSTARMSPRFGAAALQRPGQPNAGRRGSLRPQPSYTTVFNSKQMPVRNRRPSQPHFGRSGSFRMSEAHPPIAEARPADLVAAAADGEQRRANTSVDQPPPPYDSPQPRRLNRRFSVRPTTLQLAPGQVFHQHQPIPAVQAQSAVLRRLSMRPSPLARGAAGQFSGRFESPRPRPAAVAPSSSSAAAAAAAAPAAGSSVQQRTVMWRSTLVQSPERQSRTRHGSLSELNEERNERKRSDSK